ncbi:hypothetical protein HY642_05725 [Candidatus Woesearchaeota archaeon]|nr:hypothetical protein [Candidatus Woesearchaeota archaeon]
MAPHKTSNELTRADCVEQRAREQGLTKDEFLQYFGDDVQHLCVLTSRYG